jgi:hypothetical protein
VRLAFNAAKGVRSCQSKCVLKAKGCARSALASDISAISIDGCILSSREAIATKRGDCIVVANRSGFSRLDSGAPPTSAQQLLLSGYNAYAFAQYLTYFYGLSGEPVPQVPITTNDKTLTAYLSLSRKRVSHGNVSSAPITPEKKVVRAWPKAHSRAQA